MQAEVGQAAYPCYHFYKSKPHDKAQCARVQNTMCGFIRMGSQLPQCDHTSPKVGMALATSPTALLPAPSATASCGESNLAHGEQKPLVAQSSSRGGRDRVCRDHRAEV